MNQQAAGKGERRFQIIEKIKLSGICRSIAQKMMRSHAQIPAFSVSAKVDFSQVEQMITAIRQERHLRITYTDFILRATALALEKVKQLNALFSMEEEAILIPNQINLGLAVQAERGLVVPTISQANKKSIYQLCAERRRLLESVRNNRIQRGDLEQSTFTISNMGMYSVDQFTAMINPPQVGILAVGSAQQEWRVNNGQIEEWRSVTLTLTADHRVVDGHDAALFLDEVKKRLEQPVLMLLTEADTE